MTDRAEIAWAAGLFEGEGCWHLQRGRHAGASLTTTDPDVLARFATAVGIGTIRPHIWRRLEHHKPQYRWHAYGFEKVQAIAAMFWPWLGERRRGRASEVLKIARAGKLSPGASVCNRGHVRMDSNTRMYNGKRYCIDCEKINQAAYRARLREKRGE